MLFVPSSIGDAVDRLSILHIKAERLGQDDDDHEATEHVAREIAGLSKALDAILSNPTVISMYTAMKHVNAILWDVEDRLRVLEAAGDFGDEFVQQARLVYTTNDRRAALKRQLNEDLNSDLVEVKKYAA